MSPNFIFAWLAGALCLFWVSETRGAGLGGTTLSVTRQPNAEECPDAESLERRTLALGSPRAPSTEPLRIEVDFRRETDGFVAVVRTIGRSAGRRELAAPGASCEPVARATSVMLAVLLDLLPPDETTREPPSAPASAAPASAPARASAFDYFALGARAGVQYGVFGSAFSASVGGETRLRFSRFEFGLGGFFSPGRSVDSGGGTVSANLAGGTLAGCGYPTRRGSQFDWGLCASFSSARFAARGRGFFADAERASLWIAGGFGATLAFALGEHWALRSAFDVIVPFHQYTPEVARVGVAYAASPVAFALSFGPEWRFR